MRPTLVGSTADGMSVEKLRCAAQNIRQTIEKINANFFLILPHFSDVYSENNGKDLQVGSQSYELFTIFFLS